MGPASAGCEGQRLLSEGSYLFGPVTSGFLRGSKIQLLVQLLVSWADSAPSCTGSCVGQEDQDGGTQHQDCGDG